MELGDAHFAGQKSLKRRNDTPDLFRFLMHEFQTKSTDTCLQKRIHKVRCGLRFGTKYRVATSHIGENRMSTARGILDGDPVFFTRVPAVRVVRVVGQKAAKHTMLHVENGHVLVRDHFQP